jgi:hypothetical protein
MTEVVTLLVALSAEYPVAVVPPWSRSIKCSQQTACDEGGVWSFYGDYLCFACSTVFRVPALVRIVAEIGIDKKRIKCHPFNRCLFLEIAILPRLEEAFLITTGDTLACELAIQVHTRVFDRSET